MKDYDLVFVHVEAPDEAGHAGNALLKKKTIEQIGKSLNELGAFGADHAQQIRLEVHGQCQRLPIIKQIMDIADHPNVAVCWNSNPEDLLEA